MADYSQARSLKRRRDKARAYAIIESEGTKRAPVTPQQEVSFSWMPSEAFRKKKLAYDQQTQRPAKLNFT